jgi:type IV pilus assembly protein PilW
MTQLPSPKHRRRFQAGFSLIELMIAITLGLMILAGLTTIFVKNSQARSEIERSNRQLESGRYAISLLSDDLRMAGFLAQFDPRASIIKPPNPPLGDGAGNLTMATMPDPCATSVSDLNNAFFFPVQAYDESATIPSCLAGAGARAQSDILVIRRVSTCVSGPPGSPNLDADCAVVSGAPYFQSSNCYQAGELMVTGASPDDYLGFFRLGADTTTAFMNRRPLSCTAGTQADYRRYLTHIYFVADHNVAGDGIPTLKRAELGAGGFTIVPLVEGIESIQFEYGMGSSPNSAALSAYTPDPNLYNGCSGTGCVYNWLLVYAVKVNLLARNVEQSAGHTDTKTYTLGEKLPGPTSYVFGPFNDAYKRHAYNATVRLDNPSGRAD